MVVRLPAWRADSQLYLAGYFSTIPVADKPCKLLQVPVSPTRTICAHWHLPCGLCCRQAKHEQR